MLIRWIYGKRAINMMIYSKFIKLKFVVSVFYSRVLIIVFVTLLYLAAVESAFGNILSVDKNNFNCSDSNGIPFCSIVAAVAAASPGTRINIATGTYVENVIIDKNLTLNGTDAGSTIVTADSGAVFKISENIMVTITDIGISGTKKSTRGIVNDRGALVISNSNISFFSSGSAGGGIANLFGNITIINSTINNNIGFEGGGIHNRGGNLKLINCTVTENVTVSLGLFGSPTLGSGIFNALFGSGGTVELVNTIIWNNKGNGPGGNCDGIIAITSLGHNLASDGSCGTFQPGDLVLDINTSVLLHFTGLDAIGGGHFRLASVSPAIDAGDNSLCPQTDQRGIERPNGNIGSNAQCDIGAIEIVDPTPDFNNDGCVDRRGDLSMILKLIRGLVPADQSQSFDLNKDGLVNIADARKLVTLFTNPRGEDCN